MGYSDPPGCFFWIVVASVVIAAIGGYFASRGSGLGFAVAAFFGLVAFLSCGGVLTGITDQRVYDGPNCPECDARVQRIWPWSM